MALINPGFNVYASDPSLTAADLDSDMDKIIAQLGGINSANAIKGGNLTADNFATVAGFTNEQKLEPWARWQHAYVSMANNAATNEALTLFYINQDCTIQDLTLSFTDTTGSTGKSAIITVILKVNDVAAFTTVATVSGLTLAKTNTFTCGVGVVLRTGDKLEATVTVNSFTGGATGCSNINGQLGFKSKHVS